MAPLELFFFFPLFLLFFLQPSASGEICQDASCGNVRINFPFRLADQPDCCGNPSFNLSCRNRTQTMISFPFGGEFSVDDIGYSSRNLIISDPENCIPKRLLQGLDLSGVPFEIQYPRSYIVFNCSSDVSVVYPARYISCLSHENSSVVAISATLYNQYSSLLRSCPEIATIMVTFQAPDDYFDNILLTWEEPDWHYSCNYCKNPARNCKLENEENVDDECCDHYKKKTGLTTGTKYAIVILVATPIVLLVVVLINYNIQVHCQGGQRHHSNVEISSLAEPRIAAAVNGLDGPSIEAYPITLLGESCRLPRPNDSTCSICLSEYKAKETIRTIPDCEHYFHADCIDKWLQQNATCPVCRNTPDQGTASISYSTLSPSSSPP